MHPASFFRMLTGWAYFETLCRSLLMLLGSFLSPVWPLFKTLMTPFLHWETIYQGGVASALELLRLIVRIRHDDTLALTLAAGLFALALLHAGFLYGCFWLGSFSARRLQAWGEALPEQRSTLSA